MTTTITLRGRSVTAAHVLEAIAEHDNLGTVRFLHRHGYRAASRWVLRHNGRSYPSKAILGVAAGLESADFFGGVAGAGAALTRLGFVIRQTESGRIMRRELDSLRRACERAGLSVAEPSWPATDVIPTAYFASGSNRPLEIRGLSAAGADIGVAAPQLSPAALGELEALAGSEIQVFCDSGAFSEVRFGPDGPRVVQPMGDDHWQAVFSVYRRLAVALGSSAWLVAPDRVGCQQTSLERLERYAAEVAELRALGARVLVPVQKGAASQAEFAAAVDTALGFSDWVAAIPAKKAATTAAEFAAFVAARRPAHVHLLGLGIRNSQLPAFLAAAGSASVSLDSCWLTANVGRTNGPGGTPRRLTRARDAAKKILGRLRSAVGAAELAAYCCLAGAGLVR